MILLDTNVIISSKHSRSPEHLGVVNRLIEMVRNRETLVIAPQIIFEFYAIATRAVPNFGLGLSKQEAAQEVNDILRTYFLLPEVPEVITEWRNLIRKMEIYGNATHDSRLIAFMMAHQVKRLYTLNPEDYARYSEDIELI